MKKEKGQTPKKIFAAMCVGLCLAVMASGCFFRGPTPFVLGDGELEAGCVFFPDGEPPAEIPAKALPADAMAALKDWSAHLHEGLSTDFVTYAPGVTLDFEKVKAYCFEDSIVVMDKREGDAWRQYRRKTTPRDKAVRAMLLDVRRKGHQDVETQTVDISGESPLLPQEENPAQP